MSKEIYIDYLARCEGETNILIKFGEVGTEEIKLKIFEPPRFFEGFLISRSYDEVGDIVSRICGICPISHMTTAILAVENACGIEVSEQTIKLRKILAMSQIAASHVIHLYMLVLPDYFRKSSIIEMIPEFTKDVDSLIRMKEVLNGLTAIIGGRALHSVTHMPGGFTKIPDADHLKSFINKLENIKPDVEKMVMLISKLDYPSFHRQSEYVCVDNDTEYAINNGRIISSNGMNIDIGEYNEYFQETQVEYAMAKKTNIKQRSSFISGALARLNLKFDELNPETKALAEEIELNIPDYNPFHNNIAQALETHHFVEECIKLLKEIELKQEDRVRKITSGEGGAVTEAPRGLLYHWYRINRRGIVEGANIVTPTSHNFSNIEKDLHAFVDKFKYLPIYELKLDCEKLIRAYDPCFSCSVH
ncbi:MAG: nickel-dependent hydrogenase large subunit [Actinobacteria bacterium]|nr:nickel-dependent hydrogenase large subunit [Actinomycetota bacterium]